MDLIIFAVLGLAAICGGFLSVFSYLGYWQNKESGQGGCMGGFLPQNGWVLRWQKRTGTANPKQPTS